MSKLFKQRQAGNPNEGSIHSRFVHKPGQEPSRKEEFVDDWCGSCYGEEPGMSDCEVCGGTGTNPKRKVRPDSRTIEQREKASSEKIATDIVSKQTLEQALQEATVAARGWERNSPEHTTLEEMHKFISEILAKTPEEIKADGGQVLTDYFDDAKMPQFAGKLRSAVEKINQLRQVKPMATQASLTKMDAKIKMQVRDALLAGIADSVNYSAKQEVLIAKHGYFYTHGMDERKFANSIVKTLNPLGLKVNIVSTSNHWSARSESYFECRFTVEPSPIAVNPAPAASVTTPEPSGLEKLNSPENPNFVGEIPAPVISSVETEEEKRPETVFRGSLIRYRDNEEDFVDICNSRYGWAISEQLKSVLEGEPFEDQNSNALHYIMEFAQRKKEPELVGAIKAYLDSTGYDMEKGASKTAEEVPIPASVPVIAAEKVAMPLNYEQILAANGYQKDWGPNEDAVVYYLGDSEQAVLIYPDGNWEAFGGNGPNDVIGEGHGPEELQTHFDLMVQDDFENRKGSMNKSANKKIAAEPIEELPIVEDEDDITPIEDVSVDEAAPAMAPPGLDPASLGTKALGAAIKALAGVPEFMDDKSAVLWIEQLSSILKDRPIEQKAAKSKISKRCECGTKCMGDSDMCGACEKEYDLANTASSKKVAVTPPGISEDLMHKLKKEYPGQPEKAYATAWKIHNEKNSSVASAWDNVRRKLKVAGIKEADGIAWQMKANGYTPNRAAYLIGKNAAYFVEKFAMGGGGGGGFTSDQDTLDVIKGESEGSDRVTEIAQAHKERDEDGLKGDNFAKRPTTTPPIKLAAEMTPAKALKICEDTQEELKKLYLDLKPVAKVNDVAAVRNAIEAVYSAGILFDDAAKAFNKMIMAEEAEEEAVSASKKESKEASAQDTKSGTDHKASFGGLVLAASAE
jgi:hypothetical protein